MALRDIYKRLNYEFNNPELLLKALRHASYVNETDRKVEDNERLEFLGDSVLSLAIGHILMEKFPDANEGELSRLKAIIVSEKTLSKVAMKLGIGDMTVDFPTEKICCLGW